MRFRLGSFLIDEVVTGRIVKIEPRGVLVDFGAENPAYVFQEELSLVEIQAPEEAVQLNEIREFLVVGDYDWHHNFFFSDCTPETLSDDRLYEVAQSRIALNRERPVDREDLIIHTKILTVQPDGVLVRILWFICSDRAPTISFSIRELEMQKAWERVRQLQAADVTVYPKVIGKNRINAVVEVEGLQGGLVNNVDRLREEIVVGEELPLKILDAREELSYRRLTQYLRLIQPFTLAKLRQLRIGQTVSGTVRTVKQYGLFIDIGGLYVFLHQSKIIPPVAHPEQIFKVGDAVEAMVAEIVLERAWVELENCKKLA